MNLTTWTHRNRCSRGVREISQAEALIIRITLLEIKIGFPGNIIAHICTIHPWSDGTCAHSSAPSRARTMCEHGEAPCWVGNCHQLWKNFHGMGRLINSPTKPGFCWTAAGFEAFFCRSHLNYPREYRDVSHLKREDYSFYLGFDNVFLWLNVAIFWTRCRCQDWSGRSVLDVRHFDG